MPRLLPPAALTLVAVVALGGCSADAAGEELPSFTAESGRSVLPDSEVRPYLDELPRQSLSSATMPRLAPDLVPPTNRWFSGLVFGEESLPVFPLPLSFRLDEAGFTFGMPTIESRPGLVIGAMTEHVSVSTEAASVLVTRYDEVSVTTSLLGAAGEAPDESAEDSSDDSAADAAAAAFAEVTIARGSPVVSYRALAEHELTLSAPVAPADGLDGVWAVTVGEREYGLVAPEAALGDDGRTMTLPQGASANWVAVPEGASLAEVAPFAASPLLGVEVRYRMEGDRASTTLRYVTGDESPTLIGSLPHHRAGESEGDAAEECALGTAATTYGELSVCGAHELAFTVAAVAPQSAADLVALDLSGFDDADRQELVESVRLEAGSLPDLAADTYFGGKGLARIATLLALARELQQPEIAATLQSRLVEELRTWIEPAGCEERDDRCFVYDPELRGIVGLVPSFGSEDFNDHHFHYGSFLFAASVAALGDEELVEEFRPMMSLLAADVASSGGELFPTRRAFDPYSGHSWASGTSPFGDGNNQESSSEAVAAHHAVTLWGAVSQDTDLEMEGRWMLALESLAARSYWTDFDTEEAPYVGFDQGVVGIVWDGKRDYATWFSPEPAAILGIQLLPMRPGTQGSLGDDEQRILANIAEATVGGPAPQFADYLLMYQALAGPEQAQLALDAARDLPTSSIDDGNSRSYLLAWIMVQR
jgi:endo-1,3(4)-beta-glucanase